jgi:hypothetical protein
MDTQQTSGLAKRSQGCLTTQVQEETRMERKRKEKIPNSCRSMSHRRAWIPFSLSLSATDAGTQGEDAKWNWDASSEAGPRDNSLSSFSRLSSAAEPK